MMETVDAAHMRAMNSSILLKLIWKDKQISRADISRLTGMSRSTVSAIVSDLMRRGLVSESGIGHSNGGRRPVILSFNEKAYTILGLEMAAGFITATALNLKGAIEFSVQKFCDTAGDTEAALATLKEIFREVEAHCLANDQPLIGVGVSLPAPILPSSGAVPFLASLFPAWKDFPLKDWMQQQTGVPVFFEKDANLGALAELWWGAGQDGPTRSLACLKIGRSLGAGIIIDGKIYQGAHGFAGELGQLLLDEPRRGTSRLADVNRLLGTEGLRHLHAQRRSAFPESLLGESIDLKALFEAAEREDPLALELLDEAGATLGIAISNLLVILDLDRVVIGGSCSPRLRHRLLNGLRARVREQTLWPELREAVIMESPLGEQQVAIGAATMILERALNDLNLFKRQHEPSPVQRTWTDEVVFEGSH